MENGTTGRTAEVTCLVCVFYDTCRFADEPCEHFYAEGLEEVLFAKDERESKIEYLAEWGIYIKDF